MINSKARETTFVMIATFSFLVLSAYLVLWKQSNQDIRIVEAAAILFLLGVLFSSRKAPTIATAFLFTGLRWTFGAIVTHELRAIIATVIFLSVPTLILYLDARKRKSIL
jgi:hypothetical protein